MAYSIQTGSSDGDIAPGRISVEQLKQLTSEDGLTVVQKVVDDAIKDADSTIDGYAARRYVVPFSPVPEKIKNLSADIAVYNLFSKRIVTTGGEVPPGIIKRYDDAIKFLRDVSNGMAVIDGAITPAESTKLGGAAFKANERDFTKEKLKGF